MASGKGILLGALGGLLLRDARVQAVADVGRSFRSITLAGPGLQGVSFQPGDKVQVLLPSRDVRTFTPLRWDSAAGTTELPVYHHDATPAGLWVRALAVGDVCRFVGPQRSLPVPGSGRVVLFGDETSAAVARAIAATGVGLTCVLETRDEAELRVALADVAGSTTTVTRTDGDEHLGAVVEGLQRARQAGASLLLTGRAQAIVAVRAGLKARGLPGSTANRAYWSLGKTGLD